MSFSRAENVKCFSNGHRDTSSDFLWLLLWLPLRFKHSSSSSANHNNFGLFSARVFLLRFISQATEKTLRSLETDVTMRERLWLEMPYLVPSGLPLTLSSHVFQEWIVLQEAVTHIPCQAAGGGWVLSSSPAPCLLLSPLLNKRWETLTRLNWLQLEL